MKILIVHNYYRKPGGEDTVVRTELDILREAGHDVDLWTVDNADIQDTPSASLAVNTVWSGTYRKEAFERASTHKYDVAHVHNTLPLLSPAIYGGFRNAGTAVVQSIHNYRLVCPAGTLFRNGSICTKCLDSGSRMPAIQHGCYRDSRAASAMIAVMLAVHDRRHTWTRDINAFAAVSGFVKSILVQRGLPEDKIHVHPNVLGTLPDVPERFEPGDTRQHVLFAGRLVPEKGIQDLLKAWQTVSTRTGGQLVLDIVGDGPLREEVTAAASASIRYHGQVDRDDLLRMMASSSLSVVPSRWHEPFGLVAIESLSMGTPVLVSPVGGLAELSVSVPGVILADTDWAASIINAINTPMDRLSLSRAARDGYSRQKGLQRLELLYEKAIQDAS